MLKPAEPIPPGAGDDRPIGELVSRLADEGKAYAKAELGLARAVATAKADGLKVPAILFGAALLLAQAAVTIVAVAIFVALAARMGPILGGLIAFLIFAGGAGGLAWLGVYKAKRGL